MQPDPERHRYRATIVRENTRSAFPEHHRYCWRMNASKLPGRSRPRARWAGKPAGQPARVACPGRCGRPPHRGCAVEAPCGLQRGPPVNRARSLRKARSQTGPGTPGPPGRTPPGSPRRLSRSRSGRLLTRKYCGSARSRWPGRPCRAASRPGSPAGAAKSASKMTTYSALVWANA